MASERLKELFRRGGMWWHKLSGAKEITIEDYLEGAYIVWNKDEDFIYLQNELPDKEEEDKVLLLGQILKDGEVLSSKKKLKWWLNFIEQNNDKYLSELKG